MSKIPSYLSRKPIVYVKETHQLCEENPSDMSTKHIRYVKETHQIYHRFARDIS